AWVDLRLGTEFVTFTMTQTPFIDPKKPENYTKRKVISENERFILHPGEFVLGTVKEYIRLPEYLAGAVDGRSSLGRLGILTHITSTFINPGWEGRLVLEINNIGKMPVCLYPGMRICKVVFFRLSSPCEVPYGKRKDSKYQGQKTASPSRLEDEFKRKI
ncbi:MAG: dCTP deaminase, partial [Candidatus Micrarchaeota archaeon]|nr:dCTP deaminase [Candidatus Micrarchaeota archaeon]